MGPRPETNKLWGVFLYIYVILGLTTRELSCYPVVADTVPCTLLKS